MAQGTAVTHTHAYTHTHTHTHTHTRLHTYLEPKELVTVVSVIDDGRIEALFEKKAQQINSISLRAQGGACRYLTSAFLIMMPCVSSEIMGECFLLIGLTKL